MSNNVLFRCYIKDESYMLKKILKNNIDIISSKITNRYVYYIVSEEHFEKLTETIFFSIGWLLKEAIILVLPLNFFE